MRETDHHLEKAGENATREGNKGQRAGQDKTRQDKRMKGNSSLAAGHASATLVGIGMAFLQ